MIIVNICTIDNKDNECSAQGHFIILNQTQNATQNLEIIKQLKNFLFVDDYCDEELYKNILNFLFDTNSISKTFHSHFARYEISKDFSLIFV